MRRLLTAIALRARTRIAAVQPATAVTGAGISSVTEESIVARSRDIRVGRENAIATTVALIARAWVGVGITCRPRRIEAGRVCLIAGTVARRPAGTGIATVDAAIAGAITPIYAIAE